jgi:hypothetical protein
MNLQLCWHIIQLLAVLAPALLLMLIWQLAGVWEARQKVAGQPAIKAPTTSRRREVLKLTMDRRRNNSKRTTDWSEGYHGRN